MFQQQFSAAPGHFGTFQLRSELSAQLASGVYSEFRSNGESTCYGRMALRQSLFQKFRFPNFSGKLCRKWGGIRETSDEVLDKSLTDVTAQTN